MLVYISVEKFVSINFLSKRLIMRNKINQLIYFLAVVTFNLIYYMAIPFCYDVIDFNFNMTNSTPSLSCDFVDYQKQLIASYMDLTLRDIVPCTLMLFFSILLIITIFKSRRRSLGTSHQASRLTRDIRFTVMTLLMNLLFILMSLPLAVVLFVPNYYSDFLFIITFYIYYFS